MAHSVHHWPGYLCVSTQAGAVLCFWKSSILGSNFYFYNKLKIKKMSPYFYENYGEIQLILTCKNMTLLICETRIQVEAHISNVQL